MAKQTARTSIPNCPSVSVLQGATQAPVARFEIHYHQVLDPKGQILGPIPEFAKNSETLIGFYRNMFKTRAFDTKAIALQRRGQLGTYASCLGQEAVGTAIGSCMRKEDVLLPAYREYAAQFLRGVRMQDILLYWGGNETGMNFEIPRRDFPICIPIASQAPHAVGVGYAIRLRREQRVAVCVLGDGGTSKGDFYEAINAAGVWDLPIVFVVANNQWAISMPRNAQSRAETLAQKAIAAGIAGEQVDGNDVIALYERIEKALIKARNGHGPTLIEALTYRLSDHTTADDASRYRSESEVAQWWRADPLVRLRRYLSNQGNWSEKAEKELEFESQQEVERAVREYLDIPAQPAGSMFDHLYASLPESLESQRRNAIQGGRQDD
ncbi:MAG: pyruvate dehydrogenase (acetyl-transferring) E1 component subunit alpha [Methylococcaceae bacterium]|nr:pyruvate dehydrogenase (acetyl-transferring) E1 component subunit alpha [Methylococcaceae bacterium]